MLFSSGFLLHSRSHLQDISRIACVSLVPIAESHLQLKKKRYGNLRVGIGINFYLWNVGALLCIIQPRKLSCRYTAIFCLPKNKNKKGNLFRVSLFGKEKFAVGTKVHGKTSLLNVLLCPRAFLFI